ncbi:MAG: hypothetical protein P8X79_14890 [Reinekea sp.]
MESRIQVKNHHRLNREKANPSDLCMAQRQQVMLHTVSVIYCSRTHDSHSDRSLPTLAAPEELCFFLDYSASDATLMRLANLTRYLSDRILNEHLARTTVTCYYMS